MAAPARWAAALLAAVLLVGTATACTGSGTAADPASPSSPTPSTGEASPTDRSPHGVLLSAQLVLHDARRAEYTAVLAGEDAKGALFWAPKTVLKYQAEGVGRTLVVLDTSAYLGGDPGTAARLGGPHWQKFSDGRIPYGGLIDRLSPVVAVAAAAAADEPRLIGEEKLLDTTVEHYRVTVSAARYVAAQNQLDQGRRQALEAALGPGDVVLDLWLDDRDQLVRLRRAAAEVDTVDYTGFGSSAISVQAPAEADTAPGAGASPPPLP
ncbi:hypothetical protein OU787_12715 [Kitasatospora sp. YST-16]|uniref:hypothetical protein n=1 Tax=Kitasatospora sp. YST-16 TaxID=2998080 RepID=UPI002284333F|nr:hypothetical protein [Kitasatospora sp. YST-16]WAL72290.1 hypothetical protein OU787_12715 [Kitasatospora sp. YST-16]WNW38337.1 hypothetical protein RKE32_12680 [Streptomyces sp. Li-HN-5-13]